eukprot:3532622-Amphidinium_carterae.1
MKSAVRKVDKTTRGWCSERPHRQFITYHCMHCQHGQHVALMTYATSTREVAVNDIPLPAPNPPPEPKAI